MAARNTKVIQLGRISFSKALKIQEYYAKQHLENFALNKSDTKNVILIVEHNPVYTIGIRTKHYTIEEERLRQLGADFHKTNRGGLITFHGIGQLVAYPILNLKNYNIGMKKYVQTLEDIVIVTCSHFGVLAERTEDTGIWVRGKKICALGVHGKRYITTHGLALNCSTDLDWFDHIVPCGIEGKGVTSLSQETGKNVEINDALPVLLKSFSKHLTGELEVSEMQDIDLRKCY